ncbi:MAG: tyrosine-type recombinase/integrase [Clostridiales bacterium]|jgi:integrase|nr:tyrosine-type recombinase/integrase [Clostridiales bacterium]
MRKQEIIFSGNHGQLCQDFVNYKRSLGYNYDVRQCYSVKYLCDHLNECGDATTGLPRNIVEDFICHKGSESSTTQSKRVFIIRQLGIYMNSIDRTSYIPPFDYVKPDKSFTPYIYTKDEIAAIIEESEKLKALRKWPNSHLVYPMILRILFGCGLRISETLNLTEADIDLQNGTIYIGKSKFNNSRIVPMAAGLWEYCAEYYKKVGHYPSDGQYFFEVSYGKPYRSESIYCRFRTILAQAGIIHNGRGNGPRLHDARHTYAVYALEQMVQQGMDIYCALPILSTYLGHRTIESTEKYVRLVPAFHESIINSMSDIYKGLFPEVAL